MENAAYLPLALPERATSPEIKIEARRYASLLIESPRFLPPFLSDMKANMFIAHAGADFDQKERLEKFLGFLHKDIQTFNWGSVRDVELPTEDGRGNLLSLGSPEKKRTKPRLYERIASGIARGYINDRFLNQESRDEPSDWRGAVRNLRQMLFASLEHGVDLDLLERWFHLILGLYPEVASRDSLAWKSQFYASRTADPIDEEFLALASEMDHCSSLAAELLRRKGDYRENSSRYNVMSAQLSAVYSHMVGGIDPRTSRGRRDYKEYFRDKKVLREYRSKFGQLDYGWLSTQPIPPEMYEILEGAFNYPNDFEALNDAIANGYANVQNERRFLKSFSVEGGRIGFPHNLFLAYSPLREMLSNAVDPKAKQEGFKEMIRDRLEKKGKGWEAIPFWIADNKGIQHKGYLLAPISASASDQERAEVVRRLGMKYSKQLEKGIDPQAYLSESINLPFDDAEFIISRSEYLKTPRVELLLDALVPEEIRARSTHYLESNRTMSKDLPEVLTRLPVSEGYDLSRHRDLPDAIKSVIFQLHPEGGLAFSIGLFPDGSTYANNETPTIEGTIDFENEQVNVHFGEETSHMEVGLQWIVSNILLNLVRDSCCPPLREDDSQSGGLAHERQTQIPSAGRIVHIGLRGESQGKPTQKAEQKYTVDMGKLKKSVRELARVTKGANLANINRRHREDDSEDPRYLTWRSEWHQDGPLPPPQKRKAPERILS